ncbi:MAG: hypothetical protein ACLGH3_10025 [Actinomycetota bacterium]
MKRTRGRKGRAAVIGSVLAGLLVPMAASVPSEADPRWYNGPLSALYVAGHRSAGQQGKIGWAYRWRSGLTDENRIWIRTRPADSDGPWTTLARSVSLGDEFILWDTSKVSPDSATNYTVWMKLLDPEPTPPAWPYNRPAPQWVYQPFFGEIWVDHIPPKARIISPKPYLVADPETGEPQAVAIVYGSVPLLAETSDIPWQGGGVRETIWSIKGPDGQERFRGGGDSYRFTPGIHIVTLTARDAAGNETTTDPIKVIGLPQPG